MAKFKVNVDHSLDKQEAIKRLRSFSTKVREDLPIELTEIQEAWDPAGNLDFSFKAQGLKISGKMQTSETDVVVDGEIPFAALVFRGAIENQISEKVREALADD
ncbi:MAG: polyhydroxyalkanoic acid system family protein [Planctomycetota bacterium]